MYQAAVSKVDFQIDFDIEGRRKYKKELKILKKAEQKNKKLKRITTVATQIYSGMAATKMKI